MIDWFCRASLSRAFVFATVLTLPSVVVAQPAFTSRCTERALAGKPAAELRLLRNEVYARRGRAFRSPDLRAHFARFKWYRADPGYTVGRLTKTDRACLALIQRLEGRAAGSGPKATATPQTVTVPRALRGVRHLHKFGKLSPAHLEKLAQNGFVVVPAKDEQLFFVYEKNDYLDAPSFITTDSVLQLYHVFFDMTLRKVEQERLYGRLRGVVRALSRSQLQIIAQAKQPVVRHAATRNLAYLGVGADLLGAGRMRGARQPLPEEARKLMAAELQLIRAHQGRARSPILGVKVDYSQFVPRGHYTRSRRLRQFFLGMMWLSQTPFFVERRDHLLQALLLRHGLQQVRTWKDWQAIYNVTSFFVGRADELSPLDLEEVAGAVYGRVKRADHYVNPGRLRKAAKDLKARFKPRIVQQVDGAVAGANFRLMGQRYIPDSEILQRVSHYPNRRFPSGLDVMAVLGSAKAREILRKRLQVQKQWPGHVAALQRLVRDFSKLTDAEWKQNLYYGWLWALKALFQRPAGRVPAFMRTPAWEAKSVSTALGSWAELRHDTILYAKQSVMECGGDEPVPPPMGYVEPNVVFYDRMVELLKLSAAGLQRHGLLNDDLKESFKRFTELCTFLGKVSRKELQRRRLTRLEYEQIKIYGATLEYMTVALVQPGASGWSEIKSPTERHMAVIADVHTSAPNVLEVGVGPAYEILVVVPQPGGKRALARGAVFSYFEFVHPMSDRLTDEKWQKILKSGKAPPPPAWTDEFMVNRPRPSKGKPVPYGSGC